MKFKCIADGPYEGEVELNGRTLYVAVAEKLAETGHTLVGNLEEVAEDVDSDGTPDYLDTDQDNDGIPDSA